MKLRHFTVCIAVTLAASQVFAATQPVQPKPWLVQPSLSPNGQEIAFASGEDIWEVAAHGGDAHLLVSSPATESRPLWSPDGKKLAFISATGALKRMTYGDSLEQLDAWSADGKWIYYSSVDDDIDYNTDVFRVSTDGGTPTAGWIIYTGGTNLIDGAYLRLPEIRVQTMSGQTMEMHPRPVNVEVVWKPGETESNTDSQLKAAVKVLLAQINAKKKK